MCPFQDPLLLPVLWSEESFAYSHEQLSDFANKVCTFGDRWRVGLDVQKGVRQAPMCRF